MGRGQTATRQGLFKHPIEDVPRPVTRRLGTVPQYFRKPEISHLTAMVLTSHSDLPEAEAVWS